MEPAIDLDLTRVGVRSLKDEMLAAAVALGASDVHVAPGSPPVARVEGALVPLGTAVWGADASASFCRSLCSDRHWAELETLGTTDFGLAHANGDRFRVSVLRQRNGIAAVLRRIPSTLMTFAEIGLPDVVTDLLRKTRGLVLVVGPTGSGKSTTLATMVDWINENLERHIVTIEDPVEFFHHPRRSLITQREVGEDVPSFSEAMRRVLRQDPDVIMLGEMRDLDTISAAVSAAETGHLVLATLHTTGTATTVSRIIDVFPANQQAQIRVQLAMSLTGVVSQILVPERPADDPEPARPARVAALEVMLMTPAIANMIRNNEINRINDVIQTSRHMGMFRLDDHLARLVEQKRITAADALGFAMDPAALSQRLGR